MSVYLAITIDFAYLADFEFRKKNPECFSLLCIVENIANDLQLVFSSIFENTPEFIAFLLNIFQESTNHSSVV